MTDAATILADVEAALTAVDAVLDIADPAAAATLLVISKVLTGVAAAEPAALALINEIKAGGTATTADLQAAVLAYHATDDQFAADLKADGAS